MMTARCYKHCLPNPGWIPVELSEGQSGEYLGRDDIVRSQDRNGRRNASIDRT